MNWLRSWISSSTGHAPVAEESPPEEPRTGWSQYGHVVRYIFVGAVAACVLAGGGWMLLSQREHDWAVVVIAGDWHDHEGGPSQAFDNSRRDVSADLRSIGFNPDYMMQFSVRPDLDKVTHPSPSTLPDIAQDLNVLTGETHAGCLVYFSSHGAPRGIVLGTTILTPQALANVVDSTCGDRPTVIILSACFSGVFVPVLEGDDRMIMTAARADRTSFGCGQDNRYPYFDDCVVHTIPKVHSFPELADRVKDCVANMEAETGMSPPSDPQVSIGKDVAERLPTW
ncbi:MAG TPA: C13 family peptidase [Rhizomicrobium sp.]|nr:C13 family peptidase [Rhizomicrobium sp.]